MQLLSWINLNKLQHYNGLSSNPSDEALELLEQHPEKINWSELSGNSNPKALELLEKNPHKIDWDYLSQNPLIFYIPPKGARKNLT